MTTESLQDMPRAGLFRRLAALLYDAFLVAAIWMLLGYVVQVIVGTDTSQLVDGRVQTDPLVGNVLFLLMVASCAGFYVWFWTRSGQTLGMMAWRIKVVGMDNALLGHGQALLRFFLAWPAFFLAGLGYLWLYIDANGDALHDRYSHSKVIVLPKSHQPLQ